MKTFLINLFAGDRDTRWWRMLKYHLPLTGRSFYSLARWRAEKNLVWRRRVEARGEQQRRKYLAKIAATHATELAAAQRKFDADLQAERDRLTPVLGKMMQIGALLPDYSRDGEVIEFRVQLDARYLFEFGRWPERGSREMEYLADRLAHEVRRQVQTVDYATLRRLGEMPQRIRHPRRDDFHSFSSGANAL